MEKMAIKHLKFKTDEELVKETPNTYYNSPATDDDIQKMKHWLDTFVKVCGFTVELKNDINDQRIPAALKLVYSYFGSNEKILSCETEKPVGGFRFLKFNELKYEKNVIIYDAWLEDALYETDIIIYGVSLKSKKLYAIDVNKEFNLHFYKGKWCWIKDAAPLHKDLLVLLSWVFISNAKHIFKVNINNVPPISEVVYMDTFFEGYLERFNDFEHYGHSVYYNIEHGAFGWFRTIHSKCDFTFGCSDKLFIDEVIKKYNFEKLKVYK
jgi:hypothetical protein